MTRYARINAEGRCVEFVDVEPQGLFHPSIRWLPVPDALAPWADQHYLAVDDEIQPPDIGHLHRQLEQRLADIRYRIETGGIELDGRRVATDRQAQSSISNAHQALQQPLVSQVDWKGPDGWVTMTVDELAPIAAAVAVHVQAAFTAERRVAEQAIQAITIDTLSEVLPQIDLEDAFANELAAIKAG